jgi:hypothetical protein
VLVIRATAEVLDAQIEQEEYELDEELLQRMAVYG